MNDICIMIPARYKSSRLPGKPLIDLCGKSMIQRTWEQSIKAINKSLVYVLTDDIRIYEHMNEIGAKVIMTSENCLTGTDRLAEANELLDFQTIINVQGDEPIINPQDIIKIIGAAKKSPNEIICAYSEISNDEEKKSRNIPKIVKSINNELLYMSRANIPCSKDYSKTVAHKQICIYAYPNWALKFFSENDMKTPLELIEDIEILRFIENGYKVKMLKVSGKSKAVDTVEDVSIVRRILSDDTL